MEATILEREALLLPDRQRALLADRLLQSLEAKEDQAMAAWSEEVELRYDAYERGELSGVDGPQAVAAIRQRLQ
jgi:hypothetical protein